MSGTAVGGIGVPFFLDVDANARLLLCVPLLLASEVIAHRRIKVVVRQFQERGIVAPENQSGFANAINSAMRLRNSALAEVVIIAKPR